MDTAARQPDVPDEHAVRCPVMPVPPPDETPSPEGQPAGVAAPESPLGPPPGTGWLTWGSLPRPGQLFALVIVLLATYAALQVVRSLRSILVMLLVSLFISFATEPAVQWLGRRGWRRGSATGFVFLGVALTLIGAFASIVPLLVGQIGDLVDSVPRSVEELNAVLGSVPLLDLRLDPNSGLAEELTRLGADTGDVQAILLGAAGNVFNIGATAIGLLFQGLTVLLVSFYLVADGPRFRMALARPLPPRRQREMLVLWEIAVAKTGGYIYSRVLLAAVAASMTAAFLAAIQVPYPLPLGMWVGVAGAFIPVVGTYLGGILALVVALSDAPIRALWVLVFLIVYQQVENYLVAPRLQARTMDIHPAVAFVSVLAGGTLLGAVGALLALPAAAIIQAMASTYVHRHDLIEELYLASEGLDRTVPNDLPALAVPPAPDARPGAGPAGSAA